MYVRLKSLFVTFYYEHFQIYIEASIMSSHHLFSTTANTYITSCFLGTLNFLGLCLFMS